ncbi:MAG: hypothetical protein JJE55_08115 [Flavobacteriaceae bacterium]|nr:hypothetical protein [Flavobacteriaceae bacterium]
MTPKTTQYHIISHKTDVTLKLSYRGGSFFRIERVKGKITELHIKHLGKLIPLNESDLQAHYASFPDVTLKPLVKEKSQFSKFNDAWFLFYQNYAGIPPKFTGTDANHLKQIIAYLTQIEGSESGALDLWFVLLHNWKNLGEFHQKNTDLKYINSSLNKILNELKTRNNDPADAFKNAMQSDSARNFKFK